MAAVIMIQGTMSNVGKSLVTAGLLRVFYQDGHKAAPFKSQNMALNSFITKEGLEMGRAQVMQAEAACIEPHVYMNPILLKPHSHMGSQVIVNGIPIGHMSAADYFDYRKALIPKILEAYNYLGDHYDVIVIEGAGSPAEINLLKDDIVNMGLAKLVDAPVLLVGDIDRGGVFAQLAGTLILLDEEARSRIKGLVVNKFRGDLEILKPGLKQFSEMFHKEFLGVVPYVDVDIDDEDSLSQRLGHSNYGGDVDIAVVKLPHISNFTDYNVLEADERITVRYVDKPHKLGNPDIMILPGTKNTMDDLRWLRQSGLEAGIQRLAKAGKLVIGICGGYQMLGRTLEEDGQGRLAGMGLLDVDTVFQQEKTRTRVDGITGQLTGVFQPLSGTSFTGYEIHMGETRLTGETIDFSCLKGQGFTKADGCVQDNVLGTYVHGIFDSGSLKEALVKLVLERKGIHYHDAGSLDWEAYKQKQYDILADAIRESMDMKGIYEIMGMKEK